MYYILITILLILFAIFIYSRSKDIWSPSLFLCLIIAFSSLASLIGRLSWNHVELSWITATVILLGAFMFYLGEVAVKYFFKKINMPKIKMREISIYGYLNLLIIGYLFIILVWIYFDFMRITGIENNISKMISTYRMNFTSINPEFNRNDGLNFILTQLFKTALPITITYIYININNYFITKKITIQNMIPIILGSIISILISGRSEIITMIIFSAFVTIFYLFLNESEHKTNIIKVIKLIAILALIGLPTFYFMLPLLGRKVPSGLVEYVTFYLGCSLPSFDYWLHNFYPIYGYDASINFIGIQRVLSKLNLIDSFQVARYKFVSFDCNLSSNAYGMFFNYYNIFGFFGITILPFVASFFVCTLKKIVFKLADSPFIAIYLYIFSMLLDQYRSEVVFNKILDYDFIFKMFLIPLLFFIINWTKKNRLKCIFSKMFKHRKK